MIAKIPNNLFLAYRPIRKVLLFILVILLAGCAGIPIQPVSPQISLADFKIKNLGLFEQNYLLRLRLKNPNPFPLPITSLNYQLHINDKEFTRGVSNQAITLPASGEEFLDIEVVSNLMRIIEEWRDWKTVLDRNFNYQLAGGVSVLDWAPQIPFEYKGDVKLSWGAE